MKSTVKTIYDLQNGDIVFKNTRFRDKGKSFFMKVVNEITTGVQNIQRYFKGLPRIKGRDHTEFLLWNGTVLETTSSVKGPGVRTMNFLKWMEREGYPEIEILRRGQIMTVDEVTYTHRQIIIDRGVPYATIPVIKEGLTSDHKSLNLSSKDMMKRGIFCSESSKRYSGYPLWTGQYPSELFDFLIKDGFFIIYNGKSSDLIG